MADTNPFANMGLGMMGGDSAFAKNYISGGDTKKGESTILGGAVAKLLDVSGIKDFLNEKTASDTAVPSAAVPPSINYGFQPVAPISQQGINPNAMPMAVPNGIGLNAKPAGAMAPFSFQQLTSPALSADEEHKRQVTSAWGS